MVQSIFSLVQYVCISSNKIFWLSVIHSFVCVSILRPVFLDVDLTAFFITVISLFLKHFTKRFTYLYR